MSEDLELTIGDLDITDEDAVAEDFAAARALLDVDITPKSAKRGDRKGHPFRGNRYTGGIKRDNGAGTM